MYLHLWGVLEPLESYGSLGCLGFKDLSTDFTTTTIVVQSMLRVISRNAFDMETLAGCPRLQPNIGLKVVE